MVRARQERPARPRTRTTEREVRSGQGNYNKGWPKKMYENFKTFFLHLILKFQILCHSIDGRAEKTYIKIFVWFLVFGLPLYRQLAALRLIKIS